ncbi:MAG: DNA translocase FtsK [Ruminococcus sp.]|nr:DNA translocase FtsK [Ruminococcus sp.]
MAMSIAGEKSRNAVIARAIQGGVMFFLLSGAAQIFFGGEVEGAGFWLKLKGLYLDGTELHGGGIVGAVLGWSMQALFGAIGSKIMIVMLILLFALLLSNLTLPQVLRAIARPFIGGFKALREDSSYRASQRKQAAINAPESDPDFARYDNYDYDYDYYGDDYSDDYAEDYEDDRYREPEKPIKMRENRRAKPRRERLEELRRSGEAPEMDTGAVVRAVKKKKRSSIDFAKVHQAQLERIRAEEEEAKNRADKFNEEPETAEETKPAITVTSGSKKSKVVLDKDTDDIGGTEWAEEELEAAEGMEEIAEEPAEEKPKKKKSDKPPTRAEIVAEEKQKMAEQIKLDELIRKAAADSNRKQGTSSIAIDPNDEYRVPAENETVEYVYPPVELLHEGERRIAEEDIQREIQDKSARLVETLETFGVKTRIIGIHRGPAVTRYELQPAAGVKVRQVTNLADDIALNLAADSIRIEAPIPGKPAIGIEIPNVHRDSVSMRELIDSPDYRRAKGKLSFAVGKDIEGNIVIGDISAMPHMLIAGTTGSGKSVFTNSIILNILFHATPDEVKLILIDPKKVEFPMYNGIPHLLIPVVTEPLKAAGALGWAVNEMMRRYKLFEANGTKNLEDYNEMVTEMLENDPECGRSKLPQIVIVVDEFADLMLAAKNEVEESVMRLAQLARAAGMHMLIATQSPRVDVITGLIKANIPSRTALMVSNMKDSMVILDKVGAEKLLGRGDMLYQPVGMPKPMRIQSGFASTAEIRSIVDFLKNEHGADYDQEIVHEVEQNMPKPKNDEGADISINPDDDLVNQAITIIVETGNASTAYLQRKLKLGFPRAARIMDDIEAMGIIGPQEGAKPRKINITKEEWYERKGRA